MKLHQSIKTIRTVKLFNKKYRYKIVVRSPVAHWFRNKNLKYVCHQLEILKKEGKLRYKEEVKLKNISDQEYVAQLVNFFENLSDYNLRIEYPCITVYSNSEKDVETLANINIKNVRYVSLPETGVELLNSNIRILKRLDYGFRINLRAAKQDFNNFLKWSDGNPKIRITKRAKKDLSKSVSFGGSYFYVKDEKTLSLVRMFIGPCIRSIETITKP